MNGKTVVLLTQAYTLLEQAEQARNAAMKLLDKAAMESQDSRVYDALERDEFVESTDVYRILNDEGFHPKALLLL